MYSKLTDEQVNDLRIIASDMNKMLSCAQNMKEAVLLARVDNKCSQELFEMVCSFASAAEHFHKNAMSDLTFFIDE